MSGFKESAVEERKGGLNGETAEEPTVPARKSSWTGEKSMWVVSAWGCNQSSVSG